MNGTTYDEPSVTSNNYGLKELIKKSLDRLPNIQKTIILLRDLEGYSYKEIGEMLKLNEPQVKVYLFRGRKAMKNQLTEFKVFS